MVSRWSFLEDNSVLVERLNNSMTNRQCNKCFNYNLFICCKHCFAIINARYEWPLSFAWTHISVSYYLGVQTEYKRQLQQVISKQHSNIKMMTQCWDEGAKSNWDITLASFWCYNTTLVHKRLKRINYELLDKIVLMLLNNYTC